MNNHQIEAILSNVRAFRGVYSRDTLPSLKLKPTSLIVNTDRSGEVGEHWIAIHFTRNGGCEYFDPFGLPPLHRTFIKYIKKNSRKQLIYSRKSLQNVTSDLCGTYCIEFVLARSKNISYKKFLSKFGRNTVINDRKLAKKHEKYSSFQ